MSDSPHITALRKQDQLNRRAKERFRVANGKVEKYKGGTPAQDIETVIATVEKRARIANPQTGDIDERGIFLGVWEAKDRDGNSLKKKFNVFAAPEDLPEAMTYDDTVAHIAGLEDWHHHSGAGYATEEELYDAIKEGAYSGDWFIPASDILYGYRETREEILMPDNILAHHDKGALRDTFNKIESSEDRRTYPPRYWSCTKGIYGLNTRLNVSFYNGSISWDGTYTRRMSCRPVRLEPVA